MKKHSWFVKVSWIAIAAACSPPPDLVSTTLRLEMPQLAGSLFDYVEVSATQGHSTITRIPDAEGLVRLSILAGVETRLTATTFAVDDNRWRSFEGTHIFLPQAGQNDIEIEPQAVALRQGSVVPILIDASTGESVSWERPIPLTITDEATGHHNDDESFTTHVTFEIPQGRSLTASLIRPDTAEAFSIDLGLYDDAVAREIPLGDAPALPVPFSVATNDPLAIDLTAELNAAPQFPLQCAIASSCDIPDDRWGACDTLMLGDVAGDRTVNVVIRYAEIPALGCTQAVLQVDVTPPLATLQLEPPFIVDTAAPETITVTLNPSEALDVESLTLMAEDESQGRYACTTFVESTTGTGTPTYSCVLTISSWQPTQENIEISVTGTDARGNPFAPEPRQVLRHHADPPSGLLVVGVRTFPPNPSPGSDSMLLGIDVVNLSTQPAPQNWLCNLQPDFDSLIFSIAGEPSTGFQWRFDGGPFIARLPPSTLDAPIVETLWVPIHLSGQLSPGIIEVQMKVAGFRSDRQCYDWIEDALSPPSSGLTFALVDMPLQWLGNPLGIAVELWGATNISPPFVGGPTPSNPFDYTFASSNPLVNAMDGGSEGGLRGLAPGQADLTVSAPFGEGESATARVEVSPPPSVLALQNDRLTVLTPTSSETLVIADDIGTLFRVLWEPITDTIVVLGQTGIQRFPAVEASTITNPCGVDTVVDGQIIAATDGSRPGVALLARLADGSPLLCEVGFDAWHANAALPFALDPDAVCSGATVLLSDPLTGWYTILGDGCAARYATSADGLLEGPRADLGIQEVNVHRAALDPYGNFAAFVATGGVAGGWQLGFSLDRGAPWILAPGRLIDGVGDLTIDPATGATYVALHSWSQLYTEPLTSVVRINERLVNEGPSASGDIAVVSGEDLSRLAIDTGNRILYAAVNSWLTREVRVVGLDDLGSINWSTRLALPAGGYIVDLAIAGPQVVGIEPRAAQPGQEVVVFGSGFAGGNHDEVYVGGVRAELLRSTPSLAVFRVPSSFELRNVSPLNSPQTLLNVTVRAHGRMSGPGATKLVVWPHYPSRLLSSDFQSMTSCDATSGCSAPSTILDSPVGIFTVRSTMGEGAGLTRLHPFFATMTFFAGTAPVEAKVLPGGQRAIAHNGEILFEIRLPESSPQPSIEPERPIDWLTAPLGAMAADPTGRYLAIDANGPKILYATSVTPTPITLPTGFINPIEALEFFANGNNLAVAGITGQLEIFQIEPVAQIASLTVIGDDCRSDRTKLLGVWPRTTGGRSLAGLLYDQASQTLSLFNVEAAGNGFELRCTTSAHSADGPILSAAMSPYGDFVAVLSDDGTQHVALLDTEDLTRELDYRWVMDQVFATVHVALGYWDYQSPVLVLANPYVTEIIPVMITRGSSLP
ncbi:MAG: hypothetical protein A2341_25430 [Deltaproteobacteria bacterium RIFOXYB12_FULL_58_9]|nr:MAG: hypothetical protein A2341_25430 [Deltaproteobacteria bacterium RIFOXYB12_FULL_58_9]